MDLQRLVRPNILRLKPYSSARDDFQGDASVFLDANENPLAMPYNRYPDPHQRKLKKMLAELKNIHERCIFIGNGSDEAIDLLIRIFCLPGHDNVIIPQPTYGMYSVSAEINDIGIRTPSLTNTFQLEPDVTLAAADENSKIIFLCSPNNPSGNLLRRADIEAILKSFPGIVVLDEAYIDFSPEESFIHAIDRYPNLVVLQTLSKAWGLAALRLGLCIAHPDIIALMNKIKPPYNISAVTQQLVEQALAYPEQKAEWVKQLIAERNKLVQHLGSISLVEKIFPSDANFILVRLKHAEKVYHYLTQNGIIVRDRSRVVHGTGCLRITVGTPEENLELTRALERFENA